MKRKNTKTEYELESVDGQNKQTAEETLRENRIVFSQIINSIPQSVFWKDRNSVYLGCNEVFARAVGIEKPEDVVGKTDYDLPWPKEDADRYVADDREVIETRSAKRHIIEPLQQIDGTRLWIDTTKLPLTNDRGEVIGVLGVYDDVTDQKKAQEDLVESQGMLRSILDTIPVRVFWKDRNSIFLGCNKLFAIDAGLSSPDEIVGKNDYMMGWHDQAELYTADDRAIMESGIPRIDYEEPQTTPEGKQIVLCTSKIPLRNSRGEIIGVLGTYENITERKEAEKAILERQAKLDSIFRAAPVGIGVTRNRVFVEVNERLCEMLGYTREELLGQSSIIIYPTRDEYEYVGKEKYRQIRENGIGTVETRFKRKDGTFIYVLLSSTPIVPGRLEDGVTFTAQDITQMKRVHEEQLEMEKQMDAHKRQFYRETIRSVTDGKLDICDIEEVNQYINKADYYIPLVNPADIGIARDQALKYMKCKGMHKDDMQAFIIGFGEALTNAIKHAGGGMAYLGSDSDDVWVAVADNGPGIDALVLPKATLLRGFSTKTSLGLGYSIILDISDRVMLCTGPQGTTVVMFKSEVAPEELDIDVMPDTWDSLDLFKHVK